MIRHLAGIAEIVEDVDAAVKYYRDVLGLPVKHDAASGYATVELPGILHFGIWARAEAAESVFGDKNATARIPLGLTLGFEADTVDAAHDAMKARGWKFTHAPKKEPWEQITARFLQVAFVSQHGRLGALLDLLQAIEQFFKGTLCLD